MNETELLRCALRAGNAIVNDEPFELTFADGLRRIIGADVATFTTWRHASAELPHLTVAGQDAPPPAEMRTWTEQYGDHPYFANLRATGDRHPYRTSDLMPFLRFRDTGVYRDLLAQYGLRHQIAATLRFTGQDLVFIGLLRGHRDFTDREVGAVTQVWKTVSAALAYQAEVRAIRATLTRSAEPTRGPGLTERESQVLRLVAAGYTNDQTARRLAVSTRTVRKHLESVFAKAQVSSRAAAVAWWLRHRPT